jgi:quercetin dioxygenase-like cupin family protein
MTTTFASSERHSPVPSGPVLSFDLQAEAQALRSDLIGLESRHNARTLLKADDLRIVLIVSSAGARLHEHRTDNRITVQAVSGHVQLRLPDRAIDLRAAEMLVLDRGIPHDVVAQEDSVILLSINWVAADRAGRS